MESRLESRLVIGIVLPEPSTGACLNRTEGFRNKKLNLNQGVAVAELYKRDKEQNKTKRSIQAYRDIQR